MAEQCSTVVALSHYQESFFSSNILSHHQPAAAADIDVEASAPLCVQRRKASNGSIHSLEEIITCPIHLGILDDARLLACGHAFCRTCLTKFAESNHKTKGVICPVCRHECSIPKGGVVNFPVALAQNQLAYYVLEKKCKRMARKNLRASFGCDNAQDAIVEDVGGPTSFVMLNANNTAVEESQFSSTSSLESKSILLKHIVEDICRRTRLDATGTNRTECVNYAASGSSCGLNRESRECCIEQLNHLLTRLKEIDSTGCAERGEEVGGVKGETNRKDDDESEDSDTCNLDQIRRNMKKYSTYKIRHLDVYFKGSAEPWNNKEVSCADIVVDGDVSHCVMVNKTDNTVMIHNGKKLKSLEIRLPDGNLLKPTYVRAFKNRLFMSGSVQREDVGLRSLVVACDLEGTILKASSEFECRNALNQPVFCGFDIDAETQEMVVAKPHDRRVDFLNNALHRTGHSFTFEDLHPHYVAWVRSSRTLWVSCPLEGHILIVDDATGVFRKLTTNQIFNSVPSHIAYTSDQRIIFLDSRQNRVFWIMKQQDYILVQRLSFGSNTHTLLMTSIAGLSQGRILLAAVDKLSVAKPNRRITRDSNCTVL